MKNIIITIIVMTVGASTFAYNKYAPAMKRDSFLSDAVESFNGEFANTKHKGGIYVENASYEARYNTLHLNVTLFDLPKNAPDLFIYDAAVVASKGAAPGFNRLQTERLDEYVAEHACLAVIEFMNELRARNADEYFTAEVHIQLSENNIETLKYSWFRSCPDKGYY